MARLCGVNLPSEKRIEVGLTYILGIGRGEDLLIETSGSIKIKEGDRLICLKNEEVVMT